MSVTFSKCTEALIPKNAQGCLGETTQLDEVLIGQNAVATESPAVISSRQCFHVSGTALVLLLVGCVVVILCRGHFHSVLNWLEGLPLWQGCLVFVVLFTIVSFPMTFGYILCNVAVGYLYGFFTGLVIVSLSVASGCTIAFLVVRRCMRGIVESKLQSDHLKAVMRVVEGRKGWRVLALTRLTPIPFGLQNALFSITNISTTRYITASTVGLLPTQALNTYMGTTVRSMEDVVEGSNSGYVVISIQIALSALLMVYVIRRARKELNLACRQEEDMEAGQRSITVKPNLLRVMSSNDVAGMVHGKNGVVDVYSMLKISQTKHQRSKSVTTILSQSIISGDYSDETVNDN